MSYPSVELSPATVPLNKKKVVTLAPGGGFTWFGFMTGLYTLLGIAAFVAAVALGWDVLTDAGGVGDRLVPGRARHPGGHHPW